MIVLHIHDLIRYNQKKMTEKYILYMYFILEQTCRNQCSFCFFKDKKKVDVALFLDARGDEKQVINLERPKTTGHSFSPRKRVVAGYPSMNEKVRFL